MTELSAKTPEFLEKVKVCINSSLPANSVTTLKCESKFLFNEVEKHVLFLPIIDVSYMVLYKFTNHLNK